MDRLVYLRAAELFFGLPDQALAALERDLPMRRVLAGELAFGPAELRQHLHVVKDGRVRLFRLSRQGREVTLAVCGKDDVFGKLPTLGGAGERSFAEAETDVLLCRLDEATVRRLAGSHPEVAVRLVEAMGRQLAAVEELVEALTFRSAEERVAGALLRHVTRAGDPRVQVSHAQLARAAGVVRETATKVLNGLEREGLVTLGYRSLSVLDTSRLARRAGAGRR